MKRCLLMLAILLVWGISPAHADAARRATIYLPTAARYSTCTPRTPTPFGVEMYAESRAASPYFPFLLASGATWVRAPILWNNIEPYNVTPDEYDWSHADRVVGAVRDACMRMIVTHSGDPAWVESGGVAPLDDAGMVELAEYFGALVERYDGDGVQDAPGSPLVRHWELYNEPDATVKLYGSPWGYAGMEYAKMLSVVYPAIKAADPQAQVLFGGIAYDWLNDYPSLFYRGFLSDVLQAGGGDYFDIMAFHTYPPFAANWATQGPGLYEKTLFIRETLATNGLVKPIFITETAHHSNPAWPGIEGSHDMQMRYVAQQYTQALAAGVEVLVWFALADPGGDYPFDSGLVTHGPPVQIKPAFVVYQTAADQLGQARFVHRLDLAATGNVAMEAYEFVHETRGVTITVAWLDPVETEEEGTLRLRADQAVVTDLTGQTARVNDADDGGQDGLISVPIGGRPCYITVSR